MPHLFLSLLQLVLLHLLSCSLLSAGHNWLHSAIGVTFNPMVVCLAMGAVFANFALDPRGLEQTLSTVSVPVFALFFVLAGYNLHVEELQHLGILGIAYAVISISTDIFRERKWQQLAPEPLIALLIVLGISFLFQ